MDLSKICLRYETVSCFRQQTTEGLGRYLYLGSQSSEIQALPEEQRNEAEDNAVIKNGEKWLKYDNYTDNLYAQSNQPSFQFVIMYTHSYIIA